MSFSLSAVGLRYGNGQRALAELTLHAKPGECIAVIGPSGAGKSSLLGLLGGALDASEGSVEVLGQPLPRPADTAPRALRRRIGLIHQAPPLPGRQRVVTAVLAGRLGFHSTLHGLLSLLYPQDIGGARAALQRVDLADRLFQRCDQLSGGQLQRIGVARALYQRPDLLLADEPVSALDPALADATVRCLIDDAHTRGATLLASLHAVDLALAHFPRIVGLKDGVIAFDLPAREVSDAHLHQLYAAEGKRLPIQAEEAARRAVPPEPSFLRPGNCC